MLNVDLNTRRDFIRFQRDELTSSLVYAKLASIEKDEQNKKVLNAISFEELEHCEVLMKYTGIIPSPYSWKVIFYYVLARIFGLTFAIKLMENGESEAQDMYARYKDFPEVVALGQLDPEAIGTPGIFVHRVVRVPRVATAAGGFRPAG